MDWHEKEKNSPQKIKTKLKPPVSCQKMKNGMILLQRLAEFVKGIPPPTHNRKYEGDKKKKKLEICASLEA